MHPTVQGETLSYRQGQQEQRLTVGTAAWFAWLETATAFAFVSEVGSFTARREQAGNQRGGWYWKAYRKHRGKLTTRYLGKPETLTLGHLREVARVLAAAPDATAPARGADLERSAVLPATPLASSALLHPLRVTKLHRPRPRMHLVERPALIERLQQGLECPLTLVSAPAGFGKTTLLAQWLAGCDLPVAWVSLEPEDNEPVHFLTYLIAALQRLDPHLGIDALSLLHTTPSAPLETALTLLTNDLLERSTGEVVVVLEDYHMIEAEALHWGITFLLEQRLPQLHLILVTRADPPLPLARFRAQGRLLEIRAADLRFTPEEISAFMGTMLGRAVEGETLAVLEQRTEGWIAGLQLAALSLQGRTEVSPFVTAFSGSHRFVLDYLTDEVLARQSAPVQAFLLQTSILERLSGPLCHAVCGHAESQVMLEALEAANLFVVALDEERQWYRYHHLFADMLRSRLAQAEPALVLQLHRRASAWYEDHECIPEAVQHRLQALDWEEAARLVEHHGEALALGGQFSTILRWLQALPEAVVCTHPRLCYLHALALLATSQVEAAEARLAEAERAIQGEGAAPYLRPLLGRIALLQADLALAVGDRARCIALANQALPLLPETDAFWLIARQATVSAFMLSGDVTPATEAGIAVLIGPARAAGLVFMLLSCFTGLARLQMLQGRLHQAAVTLKQAAQLLPQRPGQPVLVSSPAYHFVLSELLYAWNQLPAAEHALAQGMEVLRSDLQADAGVVTAGYITLARVQHAQGDFRAALLTLETWTHLARQRRYLPLVVAQGAAWQAHLQLSAGQVTAALHWAEASGLSAGDALEYPREREFLTLVRVRIAQARVGPASLALQEALGVIARLQAEAQAKGRLSSVLEILLLRALAFDALGDQVQALAALEQALRRAEPEGYIRLFVDEGAPLVALLLRAQARGILPDYVSSLLAAAGIQTAASSSQTSELPEPLTAREREVLRLLVAGASNAAMARDLVITVGTVKRHVNSIYGKLGVTSRTQAVARAHTLHLL